MCLRQRALLAFVVAVDLAGLAAFLTMPAVGFSGDWVTFGLLVALVAAAGMQAVRFPGMKVQLTANHPIVVCALASVGPLATMAVAGSTVLGDWVAKSPKPTPIRFFFNLGAQSVAAAAAGGLFIAMGGIGRPLPGVLFPLACGTAAYFVTNSGLVSLAVALERDQSFVRIWRDAFQWTTVTYFAGVTIAAVLLMLMETVGAWGLILALPPLWMLLAFYRTYQEKVEAQRRRLHAVEAANAELEAKVAERTAALQQALRRIEGANEKLVQSNRQLVEASRAKSAFLAGVSHELRTPLNAIIGFSELIGEPSVGPLNAKQNELAHDISSSGEHLLNLINDILDLSKIEAGKMEVHRSLTDAGDLARRCVATIGPLALKKQIEVGCSVGEDVPLVEIDPGMFRGVLVNLLSNAVKFTPERGRVDVEILRRERDLCVGVRDTGIGIAPEDQQRVFQEFSQVDGSYTREYEGTGLGLALVRRMVEMHGGSVTLESRPGQGSTFRVIYPACTFDSAEAEVAQPREASRAPRESGTRTVMVVDAQALTRRIARNALRPRGYEVLEACGMAEALPLVRDRRPDLLLLDRELDDFDEMLARIRQDPVTSKVRVVALCAGGAWTDEQARQAGCERAIGKPLRLSQFPAQIDACFEHRERVA